MNEPHPYCQMNVLNISHVETIEQKKTRSSQSSSQAVEQSSSRAVEQSSRKPENQKSTKPNPNEKAQRKKDKPLKLRLEPRRSPRGIPPEREEGDELPQKEGTSRSAHACSAVTRNTTSRIGTRRADTAALFEPVLCFPLEGGGEGAMWVYEGREREGERERERERERVNDS